MAASLARGRASTFSVHLWRSCIRPSSNGYYILLPEIPPDTAETNAVMRTDQLPDFSQITPTKCVNACHKLTIEYETKLENHLESLKDLTKEITFESVYHPIEEIAVPLNTAWATVKNLGYVSSPYRNSFTKVHPIVERAKNERWVNEALYYAFKELEADKSNLSEYQQRLVDLYLLEGRLNGIALDLKDRSDLIEILKRIKKNTEAFRNRVRICTEMFTHDIKDFKMLEEMPWPMLAQMSKDSEHPERGPWRVTLDSSVYQSTLAYCSDRITRWNLWRAHHNRASQHLEERYLNNEPNMENLRLYRGDLARILGYENFVDMSMETKMAYSSEHVLSMIETLKGRFAPVLWEEMAQLQQFAESEGFKHRLEMWDISYWQRRQREHLFGVDKKKVSEYFSLNTVLLGLFDLCTKLFNINFEEVTPQVEVWHSDVRFFNIRDVNGEHISSFYIDPFTRPNKSTMPYMEMGRENSELKEVWPYSYLSLNIPQPQSPSDPPLMMFEDVQTLFQEFGHGLQQMLTRVPYSEISGQKNIEWDAVQICSKFMKQWVSVPQVVKSISGHYLTGETIPDDLLSKTLKSSYHSFNFDMMYQLYVSAFDMELYLTKTTWREIRNQIWDSFLPIPLNLDDNLPCSMIPIFCDSYPAAYYSHKWSEMIAADVFEAFREAGLDNEKEMKVLGQRFKDTFLTLGGGVPASEVFRRFRGRDPSPDALRPPEV